MYLIGICGKKGSGKDTAGKLLEKQGFDQYKFAEALKKMIYCLYEYLKINPLTARRMIDGDLKEMPCSELCGWSTRYAMQTLGTEWGRNCIDKDFWTRITIESVKQSLKAVITDVRFPNEAKAIQNEGGIIIKLLRDTNSTDNHPSEGIELVESDYDVFNNGTINDLKENLENIVQNYYERRY